ncbi:carboxypeptidase-like regulatory domain-containing protein, partial [Chryseobacterium sp. SIMBA_028]
VAGEGRISGKIVDEVGNPVVGAQITVAGKTVVTDNNGDFVVDLPSGVYVLMIKATKFNSLRVEKLSVRTHETNMISFALKPASDK